LSPDYALWYFFDLLVLESILVLKMGAIICLPEKRVWFVFCELWLLNMRPIGDISSSLLAEFTFGYLGDLYFNDLQSERNRSRFLFSGFFCSVILKKLRQP
jgi:hypothetical protein